MSSYSTFFCFMIINKFFNFFPKFFNFVVESIVLPTLFLLFQVFISCNKVTCSIRLYPKYYSNKVFIREQIALSITSTILNGLISQFFKVCLYIGLRFLYMLMLITEHDANWNYIIILLFPTLLYVFNPKILNK